MPSDHLAIICHPWAAELFREDRWDWAEAIQGGTNRTLILYESRFWVFVLQVTGIDWQPSDILTCGLDSLRGAMPGGQAIGWWRRGVAFLSYASLSSCSPLICFSNEAGRRSGVGAEGGLRRSILLLTRPRPRLPPVQRRPIHPGNAPTTHLTAVCRETHQSCLMVSAHTDGVDQAVARSLGGCYWKSMMLLCLTHYSSFFKGSLKRLFQNRADTLGRLKSLSLSI